jgi:3-dehydroquinate dehydratase
MSFIGRYSGTMEAMREAWTDRKLDALNHKVDRVEHKVDEFENRVNERFDWVETRFDLMEARFDRFEGRFDAYQRATLQMTAVVIAALIGFIATQV